jgi:hypothetical protein
MSEETFREQAGVVAGNLTGTGTVARDCSASLRWRRRHRRAEGRGAINAVNPKARAMGRWVPPWMPARPRTS